MVGIWDKPGFPHKGWSCIGVDDLGRAEGSCGMCGKEEVRYLHHMEHSNFEDTLSVGCVCAEKLEDDYVSLDGKSKAKKRESSLKNAASRRTRWLTLRGWKKSKKGNVYVTKGSYIITVFSQYSGFKYVLNKQRENQWGTVQNVGDGYFSPRAYATLDEAKLAAFDALVLHELPEKLRPKSRRVEP